MNPASDNPADPKSPRQNPTTSAPINPARLTIFPCLWKPRKMGMDGRPQTQSSIEASLPTQSASPRVLWKRRRDAILPSVLALVACAMPTLTGCQGLEQKTQETALRVEAPVKPYVSPAERSQQYREAFQQGLELTRKREYGLALGAFETALDADPNSRDALFNLGASHEALGDTFKAMTIYRRVLEIDPNDADCYRNLGTCCMKLAHRERNPAWLEVARSSWQHSLELQPNQPDVAGYLAAIDNDANP